MPPELACEPVCWTAPWALAPVASSPEAAEAALIVGEASGWWAVANLQRESAEPVLVLHLHRAAAAAAEDRVPRGDLAQARSDALSSDDSVSGVLLLVGVRLGQGQVNFSTHTHGGGARARQPSRLHV